MTSNLLYRFPSSPTASPPASEEFYPTQRFPSSTDTVHRKHTRSFSDSTLETLSPSPKVFQTLKSENRVPIHKASHNTLQYQKIWGNTSRLKNTAQAKPQPLTVRNDALEISSSPVSTLGSSSLVDIDLNAGCGENSFTDEDIVGDMSGGLQRRLSFDPAVADMLDTRRKQYLLDGRNDTSPLSTEAPYTAKYLFRKWMHSLRGQSPRHSSPLRGNALKVREERWSLDDDSPTAKPTQSQAQQQSRHKKHSSWSSSGFVTAVKTAAATITTPSSPKAKRLSLLRNSQRSSCTSQATKRGSFDSNASPRLIDDAAWERARQRRRTIEELVDSEESYVADLKVLANVSIGEVAEASQS